MKFVICNILNRQNFNRNKDSKKMIILEDVILHAPKVYILIQDFYDRSENFINFLSPGLTVRETVEQQTNFFGILPKNRDGYKKSLLDDDPFRMSVILHLSISRMFNECLDWETFLFHRDLLYKLCFSLNEKPSGVESILINKFEIQPSALSTSFKIKNNKIDEFNGALNLIMKEYDKMKFDSPDSFNDYNDYFEYMKDKSFHFLSVLEENFFFNTKKIEPFTCTLISKVNKLPLFDHFYNLEELSEPTISLDSMKSTQSQMLSIMFDLNEDDEDKDEVDGI